MKRIQCLMLTLVLAFSVLTIAPATVSLADAPPYGDANQDGKIDAADALVALRVAVNKQTISAEVTEYTDVDDNGIIDASDALLILKYSVGKLEKFPADKGQEEPAEDTDWLSMSMDEIVDEIDGETPSSAITDAYSVHNDGGLIYNPLSREMDQADKTKYNVAEKVSGNLRLNDGTVLRYSVPNNVTAYDMIPVEYTITNAGSSSKPLYVEATTFEDKDGSYYDLCLPGNVSLDFDYLGYVYADHETSNRPFLSKNFKTDVQGTQYPQYNASDLIASDTVPAGKPIWFKFKITNTGNTILDGDGNGTFCFDPYLADENGNSVKDVANMFYRLTEDLYPGESVELYIYFGESHGMSLSAGNYKVVVDCLVRNEQNAPDWGSKIWGGYNYGTAVKDIVVADTPTVTQASETTYTSHRSAVRDTWLHTYEEFTTSYDAWLNPTVDLKGQKEILYVQPAAWSDRVVLKFMRGNGDTMKSVTVPLRVETDSLSIRLNQTAENYIITDEGTKYPAMASQSMCDMRVNDSLSPYSNESQLNELLDMKECGVNLVTTTEAFNIEADKTPSGRVLNNADAIYFVSDVLRKLGMRMEGYTGYSYQSGATMTAAYWYSNDRAVLPNKITSAFGGTALDMANGLRGLYQFMRWGDNFYINGDGKVVFNTEDTRGWMRIDFNARFVTDDETITAFRAWLKQKYGTIDALNEAWSDDYSDYSYSSFDDIDPTEGTLNDHGWNGYNTATATVPEWSKGINDWDIFRTLQRTQNYETVLDVLKNYNSSVKNLGATSVDASMGIRTEGGNITGVVPADSGISHLRHAYYSQRRCAIIPQILAKSGVVSMHSDYVTLPYSVSELETLVSSSTALGITSMPLMQASRMRDIAINSKYGDNYTWHYNLAGANSKGAYINTQVSVFQTYKAVYENGGIPGVLWEDYLCDGYVTETQQKEMKFYSSKIAEMMATDEARAWASSDVPDVNAIYATSNGVYSYNEEYIQAQVDAAIARRAAQAE